MNVANLAAAALVIIGIVLVVVGLLVGGSVELAVIGLIAIAVGGVIGVFARR